MRSVRSAARSRCLAAAATAASAASTEADFKAAFAAAEAANKRSRQPAQPVDHDGEATLSDAKKAAEAGNFDKAVERVEESRSAGQGVVFQAKQEPGRHGDADWNLARLVHSSDRAAFEEHVASLAYGWPSTSFRRRSRCDGATVRADAC